MNYNRIKELQKQTKVSNEELASVLHMSKVGFEKMIKRETCTVSTLEMIANYFKVSTSYFFDEALPVKESVPLIEHHSQMMELKVTPYTCTDCIQKEKDKADLNKTINYQQEIIDKQKESIIDLQSKLIAVFEDNYGKNAKQNCG